jgi:hypothetical protein
MNSYCYVFLILTSFFRQLWSPRSPDLNLCDYCLWGHWKTGVYVHNPYWMCKEKWQYSNINFQYLKKSALSCVVKYCQQMGSMLKNWSQHFETLVWNKITWTSGEMCAINSWWRQVSYVIKFLWQLLHWNWRLKIHSTVWNST